MSRWIATELAEQEMGDGRLNRRIAKLMENLCRDASLSIPCANICWAETLAAYRFFDNDRVTFDSIMCLLRKFNSRAKGKNASHYSYR